MNMPRASVIIACRNEMPFIEDCLNSVLAGDYPNEFLEVLVVDGMSTDGSRDVVEEIARRHACVRMIDNPRRTAPAAFNVGVRAATGDAILIMSAHARYASDYVSSCVRYLFEYAADNVGGSMETVAEGSGVVARAIARVLSHPFGVGDARFRLKTGDPAWVDTVFGGCYRRDVFTRIGGFNENLVRGQDMDFNTRLIRSGGRILLVPAIKVWYIPKGGVRRFVRQNLRDGSWALRAIQIAGRTFRPRHFVPVAFVSALLIGGLLGLVWTPMRYAWICLVGIYGLLAIVSGVDVARRERDPKLAFVAPLVFALRHVSYGCGSLGGLVWSVFPAPAGRRVPPAVENR